MQGTPYKDPLPDSGSELQRSKRLIAASRKLLERGKADLKAAGERLDRARNVLQVTWLLRALRERRRK